MNSIVIQHSKYLDPPSYTAYVDRLPSLPDFKFLASLQQAKVDPAYIDKVWGNTAVTATSGVATGLSYEEKIAIVEKAQQAIRSDIQALDPSIRDFVNENFNDLLWK